MIGGLFCSWGKIDENGRPKRRCPTVQNGHRTFWAPTQEFLLDDRSDGIDGALATSTHPEELALVRKEVLSHTGGMPMLNETVKF